TVIGWGAPNLAGTAETHGAALGEKEVAAVRERLGWQYPPFVVPQAFYTAWSATEKGKAREAAWEAMYHDYQKAYPALGKELDRRMRKRLPNEFKQMVETVLLEAQSKKETMATRKASLVCLNHYAKCLPELIGGSADLTGSNLTQWKDAKVFLSHVPEGQYI